MSRNVLDKKKSHALTVWLTEKAPELQTLTLQEVAEAASRALDFHVTRGNVTGIRDAFDLDIGRHHAAIATDQAQIIEELRAKVAELTDQVSLIERKLKPCVQYFIDNGITDKSGCDPFNFNQQELLQRLA